MARWTLDDIPSLQGKTALVTGANSGLGLETARALAARGAKVVLSCRSEAKAQDAISDIRATHPDADLDILTLNLASLASVKLAAESFNKNHSQLHILCNNAGVMGLPLGQTEDGFETIFGVNHLGPFALTGLLLDVLKATPQARVVTVSSLTHKKATLPLDDLHWKHRSYKKMGAYGQSKLANLLFTFELQRRFEAQNIDAISVAAHPGYAATNVVFATDAKQTLARRFWVPLAKLGNTLMAQSAAQGALPTLFAATMPQVKGGEYYGPDGLAEFRGNPQLAPTSAVANDAVLAKKLWKQSQELTGINWL